MKKLITSIILSLVMVTATAGHTSEPIMPVPDTAFKTFILAPTPELTPSPTPAPTPTPTPTPKPTPEPTPKPKARQTDKPSVIVRVEGWATTYGDGYNGLTALPEGPGHRVRIIGPNGSIIRTSNDAGPSLAMQREGRIIDLDKDDFNTVCGCNWYVKGKVWVNVEYLK